jgi:hypothetical protein
MTWQTSKIPQNRLDNCPVSATIERLVHKGPFFMLLQYTYYSHKIITRFISGLLFESYQAGFQSHYIR